VRQSAAGIIVTQAGTGAKARTAESKARETLSAKDFGALANAVADDLPALDAAVAAAVALGMALEVPAGTYRITGTWSIGFPRLKIIPRGRVVIQADFNGGDIVLCDAGPGAVNGENIIYGCDVGGDTGTLVIRGNGSPNQRAFRARNIAEGYFGGMRARNVTRDGFVFEGVVSCVVSRLSLSYRTDGLSTESKPSRGITFDKSNANSSSNQIRMDTCIVHDALDFGVYVDNTFDLQTDNCVAEGLPNGIGLYMAPTTGDSIHNNWFSEHNPVGGDIQVAGKNILFFSAAATSASPTVPYEAVPSIQVLPGAVGVRFVGGRSHYRIKINAGAINTRLESIECHSIEDLGTGTILSDVKQSFVSNTRFPSRTLGNVPDPNPLALDRYQETVFAPVAFGSTATGTGTYDVQEGRATFVGNRVRGTIRIKQTAHTGSGGFDIGGLPAQAASIQALTPCVVIADGLAYTGTLRAAVRPGTNTIRLYAETQGAALAAVALDPSCDVHVSFDYEVA